MTKDLRDLYYMILVEKRRVEHFGVFNQIYYIELISSLGERALIKLYPNKEHWGRMGEELVYWS